MHLSNEKDAEEEVLLVLKKRCKDDKHGVKHMYLFPLTGHKYGYGTSSWVFLIGYFYIIILIFIFVFSVLLVNLNGNRIVIYSINSYKYEHRPTLPYL